MIKRIRMLSQVKRKRKLLLALTLTALITGSILAFSMEAAYSVLVYNSAQSNVSNKIAEIHDELNKLKSYAIISGDANMTSSIDNMLLELDNVIIGLNEMGIFHSALEAEFQSLKQTLTSTASEPAVESIPKTTEPTTKESVSVTLDPEKIDIAKEIVVVDRVGNILGVYFETPFEDSWVIVVSKPILGDTISDELKEYLKVTLSDARIASIVENERTTSSKGLTQDDFELTKAKGSVAPGLQPEDIKPKVPEWVRNNAGWYAEGLIPEGDFITGLEWMINNGIIQIAAPVGIGEEGVN